jgi:endonuclease IV
MDDDNFYRELKDVFGVEIRCPQKRRRWVRNNIAAIVEEGQTRLSHAEESAEYMAESPMIGMLGPVVNFAHTLFTGTNLMKKEGWEKIFKKKTRAQIKKRLSGVVGVEVVFPS